jgi:hypothetical protein
MSILTYKNKYGYLEFEVIENYRDISTIHSKDLQDNLFFEIEVAEHIALITENRDIQLSVTYDPKKMFLIHHQSSSVAAVCRITKIEFNSDFNAREILAIPSKPYGTYY